MIVMINQYEQNLSSKVINNTSRYIGTISNRAKKIFISAGDPSGDLHAAMVAEKLKIHGFAISSVGGEKLKDVSEDFIADTVSLETFGFMLSFASVLGLYGVFKKVKDYFRTQKPAAALLVDFYGFNIKIAEAASKLSIPVYYYIPPQVWASRYGRIENIKKYINKVFLTLPFEEEIYRKEKIKAIYVGNPLVEIAEEKEDSPQGDTVKIGFFPGSRSHVIKRHIGIINDVAEIIKRKLPHKKVSFHLFGLKNLNRAYTSISSSIGIVYEDDGAMKKSDIDIAMSVSGTVATELALCKIPTVIFYKIGWLNAMVLKKLIKTKYVALPNILLDYEVFPECLQENSTPEILSEKIIGYIENPPGRRDVKKKLKRIREMLHPSDASIRVAENIMKETVGTS